MNHQTKHNLSFLDEESHRTWEDMRLEILHELQDGASADVPDSEMDNLGNLVIELASWRGKKKQNKLEVIPRRNTQLMKILK